MLDGKMLEISGEWKKEKVRIQMLDGKTLAISRAEERGGVEE